MTTTCCPRWTRRPSQADEDQADRHACSLVGSLARPCPSWAARSSHRADRQAIGSSSPSGAACCPLVLLGRRAIPAPTAAEHPCRAGLGQLLPLYAPGSLPGASSTVGMIQRLAIAIIAPGCSTFTAYACDSGCPSSAGVAAVADPAEEMVGGCRTAHQLHQTRPSIIVIA